MAIVSVSGDPYPRNAHVRILLKRKRREYQIRGPRKKMETGETEGQALRWARLPDWENPGCDPTDGHETPVAFPPPGWQTPASPLLPGEGTRTSRI